MLGVMQIKRISVAEFREEYPNAKYSDEYAIGSYPYKGRNLFLLRDELLLKLIAPERMTASRLLYIPTSAKRLEYEMYNGIVLAAGPGVVRSKDGRRNPVEVRVGQKVMFYWMAGETRMGTKLIDADGSELRVVSESNVMGVWDAE